MENKEKKSLYYRLLIVGAIIVPVIIGFSYAYFLSAVKVTNNNPTVISGKVTSQMIFNIETENDGYINATNLIPLREEQIEEYANVGTFRVSSGNNSNNIIYELSLTNISITNNLKSSSFKWQLVCTSCSDESKNASGNFSTVSGTDMVLKTNVMIAPNTNDDYKLLLWIQEDGTDQTSLMNQSFSAKVKAVGELTYENLQ